MQITNSLQQLTNIPPIIENISSIENNTIPIQTNNKPTDFPITTINERKLQPLANNDYFAESMPLVSSLNTEEFIEVTRRIRKSELEFINNQLNCVNNQELAKLQQISQQPELILTTENAFFSDKKFPFIILKALQLGILSVFEFASLQTWHEVYNEQKLLNPETNPQLYKLFNTDNSYNETAWEIIISTIESCNNSLNKNVLQINSSEIISTLKQQSPSNSAVNNCFILFPLATAIDNNSLYKRLLNSGMKFFAIYQNNRISASITLCQNFLNATFINNLCKINPVIGISTPQDIRDSAYCLLRDFAIPFPSHPFPQKVHGYLVKEILEFQLHDIYHVFHMCLMTPEAIKFYLTIGDALLNLRNKCDVTIKLLKKLAILKIDKLDSFKNKLKKISPRNAIKAEKLLFNEFYVLKKVLDKLKTMRKAYGQLKFEMYDADVRHFENRETKLIYKYGKNGIFMLNIILLFIRKNKEFPVLSGLAAQLAGRTAVEAANNMLNMHESCKYFIDYFNNDYTGTRKESILNFLTGGIKALES
jgi:hypothetical protein